MSKRSIFLDQSLVRLLIILRFAMFVKFHRRISKFDRKGHVALKPAESGVMRMRVMPADLNPILF